MSGTPIDIDLYSDTLTMPSRAMREFMCACPVGDEQKGEDPTVNALQERIAAMLGKPAALFMPSATMANQIAIKCHTQPGDEIVADAMSHTLHYEAGGPAFHSGVMVRALSGARGCFTAADVAAVLRPTDSQYMPRTRLVWVENTHNLAGGTVWRLPDLEGVSAFARAHDLAVHLDGARIFNASAASGVPADVYAALADTVTVCFSKGLGCPGGAVLVGPAGLIGRARRYKQLFGGAMRQASGILAGAALYALDHNLGRLAEDHANARRLAEGLAGVPGVTPEDAETNMVYFRVADTDDFHAACLQRGLRFSKQLGNRLRAVTHLDVDAEGIERALAIVREVAGGSPRGSVHPDPRYRDERT